MNRKFWVIALAVWMILYGFLAVTNVRFEAQSLIMGLLAFAVAILALLDR